MQKLLFEMDEHENLEPQFEIGKAVRNASYQAIQPRIGLEQQRVYTELLLHPEGLTDHEIAFHTELTLSSVNGRRNELMHQGLVKPIGIVSYEDEQSTLRVRTLWGAI